MSNKMKNMRAALLFFLVAVISLSVSAQNVAVTGTVTDKTGETVIGASVVEKGNAGNGTITDIDGNFSLNVPANATLVFSYVGMKSQEIALKGKTKVDIVMEDDAQALEEVVVIGYGTVQKKDLTGSVRLQQLKVHLMQISKSVYAVVVLFHKITRLFIS